MAKTPVRDVVIWAKHIHGEDQLVARLNAMQGGETIELRIDGFSGTWRKMTDGRDGRSTPGIRPIGAAQAFWRELYASRRGDVVDVEPAQLGPPPVVYPPPGALEEQDAAWERLRALMNAGYRSEGRTMTRDEANER